MPTLKAIHICNSHQPTRKLKIAKEYVFANADRQMQKNTERTTLPKNNPAGRYRLFLARPLWVIPGELYVSRYRLILKQQLKRLPLHKLIINGF